MKGQRKKRFGLVGHPLGHSLSPLLHERIMAAANIEGEYGLYDIAPEHLGRELPRLFEELDGFNCTIPHKQVIIPYLEGLTASAKRYGAVNTVFAVHGYNTDGAGFRAAAMPLENRHVLILGAGGVARVLAKEAAAATAASLTILARNTVQARALAEEIRAEGFSAIEVLAEAPENHPLWQKAPTVLNGTPLGMWPKTGDLPLSRQQLKQSGAVFDSVYNPTATRLVLQAKSLGIPAQGGLEMLFTQALEAQRIWNPGVNFTHVLCEKRAILGDLAQAVLRQNPLKLLLTGFMGSGKTLAGYLLAQAMGGEPPFLDLDTLIEQKAGKPIAEIFATQGESYFRNLERQCLAEQLKAPGSAIIATGGGALVQSGAEELIHSHSTLVIYLEAPLEVALQRTAGDENRPLLHDKAKVAALYEERLPLYRQIADLTLSATAAPSQTVHQIQSALGWITETRN